MSRTEIEFEFRGGSRLPNARAEEFGRALDQLRARNGGRLTAEIAVDAARGEGEYKGPLGWVLEPDVEKAARKHWCEQMRHAMRSLEVVSVVDGREKRAPALFSIEVEVEHSNDGWGPAFEYIASGDVLRSPALRASLLAQAHKEMEAFERKYGKLRELARVFEAFDSVREKGGRKKQTREVDVEVRDE